MVALTAMSKARFVVHCTAAKAGGRSSKSGTP